MGEYDEFKPKDDWGSGSDDRDDTAAYVPGGGAMVAMGYEGSEYGNPQQYTPYTGYGPGLAMTDYPHGPHDEPDMGFEWGGRRHRGGHDRRGFFARLFNLRHEAPQAAPQAPVERWPAWQDEAALRIESDRHHRGLRF